MTEICDITIKKSKILHRDPPIKDPCGSGIILGVSLAGSEQNG